MQHRAADVLLPLCTVCMAPIAFLPILGRRDPPLIRGAN